MRGWVIKNPIILADNGPFPVTLTCHNCNTKFEFTQDEVKAIL